MAINNDDGTSKNMFGISVGGSRVDIRSNAGEIEVRNYNGQFRKVQTRTIMMVTAPTVNEDANSGYLVGDNVFNTVTNKKYICKDNTVGAAVWQEEGVVNQVGSRLLYVDGNRTDTYTEAGTAVYPYKTIQAALTAIGIPADGHDAERVYTVLVEGGIYDEELNVPEGRMIILAATGGVVLGLNTFPVATPRSINYLVDTTKRKDPGGGIGNIRPVLAIVSLPAVKSVSTHIGRENAWYITGNINKINSSNNAANQASHDLLLKGVKIDGLLRNTGTATVGQSSVYAEDVQFVGGIDQGALGAIHLQEMTRCVTNAAATLYKFGLVRETKFGAAVTVSAAVSTDFSPTGFFNCDMGSITFTGPANSFKCDASCINLPTYAGGAATVLIDQSQLVSFTPAVPGNWTTSPTQVKAALDELGARSTGGGGVWGSITGTLSAQTDLNNALGTKITRITANTTVYVSTTGNDTTGDGTAGNPWLTWAKANSWLADKYVDPGYTVTIQFSSGAFTTPATTWERTDGGRIVIAGTATTSTNLSSVQSGSAITNGYRYVLNVANASLVSIGDFVWIQGAVNGTYPNALAGFHLVSNVDTGNNRITIDVLYKYVLYASGATLGTIFIVKTRFDMGTNPLTVTNGGILQLNSIAIYSTRTNFAVEVNKGGTLYGGTLVNGIYNTSQMAVQVTQNGFLGANGGYWGFAGSVKVVNARITITNATINGASYGLDAELGSIVYGDITIVGCDYGIYAAVNATISMNSSSVKISFNGQYGIYAFGSRISIQQITIAYNQRGIYAVNGTYVQARFVTFTSNFSGDSDPAVNTLAYGQSYVYF